MRQNVCLSETQTCCQEPARHCRLDARYCRSSALPRSARHCRSMQNAQKQLRLQATFRYGLADVLCQVH
jgi:hypothetical protein